ncbi:ribbon-helix-helix domain-containing protein [Streptomyces scabiei]|uniref:ribbon-helix-helix domain-containing protein n=1 Tax=Streptomyces scabiei TaxID=1930 RepID=UPI0033D8DFCC
MPRTNRLYTNPVSVYLSDQEIENLDRLTRETGNNRSVIIRAGLNIIFERHGLPINTLIIHDGS